MSVHYNCFITQLLEFKAKMVSNSLTILFYQNKKGYITEKLLFISRLLLVQSVGLW